MTMAGVGAKGVEFTDTDGVKMKWDPERRAYFPALAMDDAFMSTYRMAYGAWVHGTSACLGRWGGFQSTSN